MLRTRVEQELGVDDSKKTARMFQLERQYGRSIVELIRPRLGIASDVHARSLGIGKATLSVWRQRFGMLNNVVVKPGPKPKQRNGGSS